MFAGIIEQIGTIRGVSAAPRPKAGGGSAYVLDVEATAYFGELERGASVAVNGACLTLTDRSADRATFDVVPETWENTTVSQLRIGTRVNLERSLRFGGRIDGHFVQGHIDGVGRAERIDQAGGEWRLWVSCAAPLLPYIIRKGSIALDGTSLTIAAVDGRSFAVALVPTTLEHTVLRDRQPGDPINIETDILARLVFRQLQALSGTSQDDAGAGGITFEMLQAGGFA
jgi:riboflavin synthase alpha subunit